MLSRIMEYEYPGFRFYPIEEELISFYLHNKLHGRRPDIDRVIPVVDIYDHLPSQLPQLAGEYCRGDSEQWFFFVPMQDREAKGGRPNRLTNEGYWKATGSPSYVYSSQNHSIIGVKRTMVFYKGRAPNGDKTPWKMNEYKAIDSQAPFSNPPKLRHELSLCRVYNGSKSVRAFDRRPPPPGDGVLHHNDHDHHDHHDNQLPTISSHPIRSSTLAEGSSSISLSSSPGENSANNPLPAPPQALMETHRSYDDVDFQNDEPVWDWEQLNWFY